MTWVDIVLMPTYILGGGASIATIVVTWIIFLALFALPILWVFKHIISGAVFSNDKPWLRMYKDDKDGH